MHQVKLLFLLFCCSQQTDIELEPFEYVTDVPSIVTDFENFTEAFNNVTTQRTLTVQELCLTSLNLSRNVFEENGITDNNTDYKDFLSCYWKKKKIQSSNGKINFTVLEEMINHAVKISVDITDVPLSNAWDISNEIMEECKTVDGNTQGHKAVKVRNCMYGKLLYQRRENHVLNQFEDIPYLELAEEACVNELKLGALEIEDINRHYLVVENNTDFQMFLECYWKEIEFMDKNGTINISTLQLKFVEDIEFEILSRSRAAYLTDILTKSIIKECKTITGRNHVELVVNVQNYILKRLPYFKVILKYEETDY